VQLIGAAQREYPRHEQGRGGNEQQRPWHTGRFQGAQAVLYADEGQREAAERGHHGPPAGAKGQFAEDLTPPQRCDHSRFTLGISV
jgi:hypothetical protein